MAKGKRERLKRLRAYKKYEWLDLYAGWIDLVDDRCRRHLGWGIKAGRHPGARFSTVALEVAPEEDPLLGLEGAPPVPEMLRDPVKGGMHPHPGFASDESEPLGTALDQIMNGLEWLNPWVQMPVMGQE